MTTPVDPFGTGGHGEDRAGTAPDTRWPGPAWPAEPAAGARDGHHLAGRHTERALLAEAVDRLAEGHSGLVELAGDPGIGKTRLLHELRRQAGGRGLRVVSGRCAKHERDRPFAVWAAAFELPLRECAVRGELPPGVAEQLGAVWPALSGRGQPPGEAPAGAARPRFFQALRQAIAALATAGLVLVLDDLHWADPASVELLEHLIADPPAGPLLLALAHRPRQTPHRLRAALARRGVEGGVTQLKLGPLSRSDTAELLAGNWTGTELDEFHRQGDGNPLYLLILAGLPGEDRTGPAAPVPVPEGLEDQVLGELASLEPGEWQVARAAAVLGDPFDIDSAGVVAALDPGVAETAMEALARLDLIRPVPRSPAFTFRHPLLRNIIYHCTSPVWRITAHRRALAELTRQGAAAVRRAHHAEQCGRPGGPEFDVLHQAALESLADSPVNAAHWLRAAARLLPGPAGTDHRHGEVDLLLARALGVTGRLAESRDLLHELLRDTRDTTAPQPRVRAETVAFCAMTERLLGRHHEATSLLRQEMRRTPDDCPAAFAALAVEIGATAILTDDYPGAKPHVRRALAEAGSRGDHLTLAAGQATDALGDAHAGHNDSARVTLAAVVPAVDGMTDSALRANGQILSRIGWAELLLERFEHAHRHFARGLAIMRRSGQRHLVPHLLGGLSQVALHLGNVEVAVAHAEEAERSTRPTGNQHLLSLVLAWKSLALRHSRAAGAAAQALRHAQQAVRLAAGSTGWYARVALLSLAEASLLTGEARECLAALHRAGGPDLAAIEGSQGPRCLELAVTAGLALDDVDGAARWAGLAAERSAGLGLPGQRGHAERAAARLARFRGEPVAAATAHESALAAFTRAGMLLEADRTRRWAAPDPVSPLPQPVPPPETASEALPNDSLAVLSEREREITELVRTGQTSRQIAQRLLLSTRTVETHLSNIYRKLDIPCRAALASLAERTSTTQVHIP